MSRRAPDDRDLGRFLPRVTIAVLAGFALFAVLALGYALPDCWSEPPPGAIPDYCQERVKARLEGKVTWMLAGSFLTVAALAIRGILPGTGPRP